VLMTIPTISTKMHISILPLQEQWETIERFVAARSRTNKKRSRPSDYPITRLVTIQPVSHAILNISSRGVRL
jgi:hypothetical protein